MDQRNVTLMPFEGPEKKLELIFQGSTDLLYSLSDSDIAAILRSAGAKELSRIENNHCKAILLSESSLFIFKDRLVLITCGQTTLIQSAELLFKSFTKNDMKAVYYERKNEHFPLHQKSSFIQDATTLQKHLGGKALCFGDLDEHHLHLYWWENNFKAEKDDHTVEILMHGIPGSISSFFEKKNMASRDPKDHLSFLKIFEGFSFDDFGFDPFGYSLNGFKEKSYMTLHVTPQSIGSYISLETNMKLGTEGLSALLDHVVNDFEPNSFDVFSFHPSKWLPIQPEARAYSAKRHIQSQLPSGFYINFYHFYAPTQMRADPIELF